MQGTKAPRQTGTKGQGSGGLLRTNPAQPRSHFVPPCLRAFVPPPRRGFSFVEILFAVIILGIGFIMVAAMFPVAIHQSRTSAEETTAAAVARNAVKFLESAGQQPLSGIALFGPTPTPAGGAGPLVMPVGAVGSPTEQVARWNAIKGSLIVSENPRYGWTVLYRRADGSPWAQIWIVTLANRDGQRYHPLRDLGGTTSPQNQQSPFFPWQVSVMTQAGPGGTSRLRFTDLNQPGANAAAHGAFVIIGRDHQSDPTDLRRAQAGRIYRLGNRVSDDTWDLVPGYDLNLDPDLAALEEITAPRLAWVIGRQLQNTAEPFHPTDNPFVGTAQDITIYTTFINVR